MAKIKCFYWNNSIDDVISELKTQHELVEKWEDADVILIWNEIKRGGWLDIIEKAHKMGKKVILYQQGIWGIDRVQPPWNEKIHSDAICVWGEGDRKRLEKYGVDSKKIFVTGTPIFKHLKPKIRHDWKNIVFALEHWDTEDVVENMMVASELRELKGVNVVTKALEGEHNLDLYDNVVVSKRNDKNHIEVVADLLSMTDLVVAISESTFALMAEIMDIPVVIADIWIPKDRAGEKEWFNFKHPFTDAITKCKLEDLNKTIMYQLKHPEIKREERRKYAIENGGVDIENPVQKIIDVINENTRNN